MMRAWHPLLLLLGIVFLASVSVSFGITQKQQCLQSCESEQDPYKLQQCKIHCRVVPEHEEQQEEREHQQPHEERGQRERGRQEGEKAEKEQDKREQPRPFPHPRQKEHEHEEEHKRPRGNPEECEGSDESESQKQNNPYHFNSKSFHTLFKNQYGHIRLLQRFNQRSPQLQNLLDYRVLEFKFNPNALFLPHHADSQFLLVVISGRALLTLVNNDARDSYNLQPGDGLRIPAGTTYYLVNPHDNETLRVVTLAIPVNKPGRFESFFLSSTQDQQSYLQGFSENIMEASFKTEFEEINRVLLGEEGQQRGEQRLQERVIVKLSKKQIQELGRHAKSSSRKTISSEDEPFNLRSRKPIYSNKFGKFHEITPEKNSQLRELDIFLSFVDINEGALLLPHFNSKAIVILVINEGEAIVELVGLKEQQQKQQQEEQPLEVRRYRAELSEDDIFVIPAAYPFVVNATSNLNFLAFGINAENNQRNFLAGSKDNVISQIHRQVQELAFPGSAQDVEKLIKNQRESYFVDAQPQQKEEGRKGSLSSILGAFY